jgi:hypothetical protein
VTVIDPEDPEETAEGGIAIVVPADQMEVYHAAAVVAAAAAAAAQDQEGAACLNPAAAALSAAADPPHSTVSSNPVSRALAWRRRATVRYVQLPTPLRTEGAMAKLRARARERGCSDALRWSASVLVADLAVVVRLRSLWRVLLFNFAVSWVSLQWVFSAAIMGVYLERNFGEETPIYLIHSINLWGCLLFPPIVAALTGSGDTWRVMMPGLWLMALSPIVMLRGAGTTAPGQAPSGAGPGSCAVWQVLLTMGEVMWSPRNQAWSA